MWYRNEDNLCLLLWNQHWIEQQGECALSRTVPYVNTYLVWHLGSSNCINTCSWLANKVHVLNKKHLSNASSLCVIIESNKYLCILKLSSVSSTLPWCLQMEFSELIENTEMDTDNILFNIVYKTWKWSHATDPCSIPLLIRSCVYAWQGSCVQRHVCQGLGDWLPTPESFKTLSVLAVSDQEKQILGENKVNRRWLYLMELQSIKSNCWVCEHRWNFQPRQGKGKKRVWIAFKHQNKDKTMKSILNAEDECHWYLIFKCIA